MSTAPQPQAVSPATVFNTLNAYQHTKVLRGALELDLFTAIAEGNVTSAAIASRIQASERGVRVVCDFLTVIGFLTKQDHKYDLAPVSAAFLNRHSPAYLGSIVTFLADPRLTVGFDDIAGLVRKGGTLFEGEGTVDPDNPIWVEFAESMAPLARMGAALLAKMLEASKGETWKVLDIAAGHGLYGITIAQQNPNAEIVAVDWEAVLAVAKRNAEKAGVSNRYSTNPGSAFDVDFGTGYDLVLLTNFLHHFSPEVNEGLLRKVHASLAPGGRAITVELIPNDDRVTPATDAMFSLNMLGTTTDGDAFTFAEFERMFRNAGFSRSEMRELAPSPQRVIVSYK